mmetsp:Transcript_14704/g.30399  ORF Transcript_14704/g.30399 Transcript_14704/m.30399 type:complete len:305 (-) Transcript_14704:124-1038(-)|eukprot:CAMPEP_0201257634 /NCGR_PEP_ID=MMETSP0853-20130426/1702_1 /ASSEMBLY_ACC=CAM_ASM_000640 /TAXON_ID=183588 /ORGANISM="Pseudo-nitzschia fraudulenta, Strain WWA7" /LENGTH=304 /DNA_ID=CAMNT_0047558409 /DNA_START=28 /DNA_END=942 /DNA_ORIENTATION=+
MLPEIYLVLSATGRQGSAVVDALVANNANVFGSSRNPESLRKIRGGTIKVVHADMNDTASIIRALDKSKATRVWFTTDWYSISKPTRAKEAQLGYNVIDAIKQRSNQVQHVVFNSGCGVGIATGPRMGEFQSKGDVELYMAKELSSVQITWSVLRPVAFMENLDDEKNGNSLKKGSVKMLTKPGYSVNYISCTDIGKGSAVLLLNPELYAGRKIDAATGSYTGPELAKALSKASGVACKYSMSVPRFVLYLFVGDLYKLVTWIEGGGYDDVEIEPFRKIVPDYQDAQAWFAAKGQWANGELFSN